MGKTAKYVLIVTAGFPIALVLAIGLNANATDVPERQNIPFTRQCFWWLEQQLEQRLVLLSYGEVEVGEPSIYEQWAELEFGLDFKAYGTDPIDSLRDLTILGHHRMDTIFIAFGKDVFTKPTGERLAGHNCANVAYVTMDGKCDRETFLHELGHTLGFGHTPEGTMAEKITC